MARYLYTPLWVIALTLARRCGVQFDCRAISEELSVLSVDNSITCQDSMWTLVAIFAALGLLFVSFGVPLLMLYIMWKAMNEKHKQIHRGEKKAVVAYNEFGQEFDYVVLCNSYLPFLIS